MTYEKNYLLTWEVERYFWYVPEFLFLFSWKEIFYVLKINLLNLIFRIYYIWDYIACIWMKVRLSFKNYPLVFVHFSNHILCGPSYTWCKFLLISLINNFSFRITQAHNIPVPSSSSSSSCPCPLPSWGLGLEECTIKPTHGHLFHHKLPMDQMDL